MNKLPSLESLAPTEVSEKSGILYYLIVFLVVAIIAYVVLYSWNPEMLQKKNGTVTTGQVDPWKVLLASAVISLVVVVIVWLFRRS
jgi:uncharacterized membrane protein